MKQSDLMQMIYGNTWGESQKVVIDRAQRKKLFMMRSKHLILRMNTKLSGYSPYLNLQLSLAKADSSISLISGDKWKIRRGRGGGKLVRKWRKRQEK